MGIMDLLRKSKEKKEDEKATTPPPQGHTLAEIMQDTKKFHLFGELLKHSGGNEDLAQRLFSKKLEEGDIALLEEQRKKFSEKIINSERIEKLLTKEKIIELARNNPDFASVVNSLTPERAVKVITSQLKEIAISDESKFNQIVSNLEAQADYLNKGYKKTEEKVEKLLKEKSITPEEYSEVLAIQDIKQKVEALKKLSYRTNGFLKRTVNELSFGKFAKDSTFKELGDSETEMENSLAELNAHSANIGAALFMTINENKVMRDAFSAELINEKAPSEKKIEFKDIKKNAFDEKSFDDFWEEEKERVGFSGLGVDSRETFKEEFIAGAKGHYKAQDEGSGFWHDIRMAFIGGLINEKKAKLK